jgi:hypothetical protein
MLKQSGTIRTHGISGKAGTKIINTTSKNFTLERINRSTTKSN